MQMFLFMESNLQYLWTEKNKKKTVAVAQSISSYQQNQQKWSPVSAHLETGAALCKEVLRSAVHQYPAPHPIQLLYLHSLFKQDRNQLFICDASSSHVKLYNII